MTNKIQNPNIKYETAVIGGGAAGIVAAISAGRKGDSVVICERMPQLGKKILASGNGRCNLLNDDLGESHYNIDARPLVKSVFAKFARSDILNFFKKIGLEVYSEDGRVFPVTNQSSSVLKVLEMELQRLDIPVELNFNAVDIIPSKNGFTVKSKTQETIECANVIITCGGKTYPSLGSDGNAYNLARRLGHSIIEPVPAAVPLVVRSSLCHILQGQRISVTAKSVIGGRVTLEAEGDLLFTKYGLSGTAILDISEDVSIAINRDKKKYVLAAIDMIPFMESGELKDELVKRKNKGALPEELLIGILPNKFGPALKELLHQKDIDDIIKNLKDMRFEVTDTRGWNEAEFTSGGVAVNEIKDRTLESKLKKGIYFAGEILDVTGKRGGYNLAWAWASGFVAGLTE